MNEYKAILAGVALLAVPALCSAALVESFEDGTTGSFYAGNAGGLSPITAVNNNQVSDGSLSFESVFTVGDGDYSWNPRTILGSGAKDILTAGDTTMSMDVYSDWTNPLGWGLWGEGIRLVKSNDSALAGGGWGMIDPSSVVDNGGGWKTYTFDISGVIDGALDPLASYSGMDISWFTGGGPDGFVGSNGVQTISIDNIQVIPEPATLGLVAFAGAGVLFVRRHFRI